jgi:hypothetical protein
MSLNVTEVTDLDQSPVIKPVPKFEKLQYLYAPSPDGIDENLLILFHGFGVSFLFTLHASLLPSNHAPVLIDN